MDKYKETFETWNKVAALYQEKFMGLELYNESYDFICESVSMERAKLLEIGCGPGNIAKYLLSKRPDFDIVGIDIAPKMIELAQNNNPSARFMIMDSREIDRLEAKFDGIICGFCLPYLSQADRRKLIKDCCNLLHEDGLFYVSFIEGDPDKSGFQTGSTGHRSYFYYHTLNDLREELAENHFMELKTFKVEYVRSKDDVQVHTILTARKKPL